MKPIVGIMTTRRPDYFPFPEKKYYAELAEHAREKNMEVCVFFPESISFVTRSITGFFHQGERWVKQMIPFPSMVYDRVFYDASYYQKNKSVIKRFKQEPNVYFLNRGLPSKWEIYQLLKKEKELDPYLPTQELYQDLNQLSKWLFQKGSLILKPIAGGFGKRVYHLIKEDSIILEGRNSENQFFRKSFNTLSDAYKFLGPKLNHRYLVQNYLNLNTLDGFPYDIRIFAQKNHEGIWNVVGKGVRIGPKHKLTSNLHGGGTAQPFRPFIELIHPSKAIILEKELDHIGSLLPQLIETYYSPIFELGIDVGIDHEGNAWILEVNGKPGRQIFRFIGDKEGYQLVNKGPINYAHYLLKEYEEGAHDHYKAHAAKNLTTK